MNQEDLEKKWLLGTLEEGETKAFHALEDADFYENIVKDAAAFKAADFSETPDFASFKKTRMPQAAPTPVRSLWRGRFLRIASVFVILFGLYYLFLLNNGTDIATGMAEKTEITLPDGSIASLNAGSSLAFNENDWDTERSVTLTGEAYFDVEKGSKFDVVTENGTVSVLGTEFNVRLREGILEVRCYEGSVRVQRGAVTEILQVGDNVQLTGTKAVLGNHTATTPEWTQNKSVFERTKATVVFAEMERQFGVSIDHDAIDSEMRFTGGFDHNDLENALKAVTLPLDLEYEILKPDMVRLSTRE